MNHQSRRSFLKSAAIASAALGLPASSWARVIGANDEIRVAVVGFNGRGKDHISGFRDLASKNVRIVALIGGTAWAATGMQSERHKTGAHAGVFILAALQR